MTKISKTAALELIRNSKGRFFTVTFTKSNGQKRTINCQYMSGQKETGLGIVKVKETKLLKSERVDEWVKSFKIDRLEEVKINKTHYQIKK